jgi:hypothetical protein
MLNSAFYYFFFFRNIQEDVSMDAEICHGDNQSSAESLSADKVEVTDPEIKVVRTIRSGPFLGSKL